MKHLYINLFALAGSLAYSQEVEVRWQKDLKSTSQDFLSQLNTTIDGQHLLSGSTIQSPTPTPTTSDNQTTTVTITIWSSSTKRDKLSARNTLVAKAKVFI